MDHALLPSSVTFTNAISSTSPDDVWLAGQDDQRFDGVVAHWDGATIQEVYRSDNISLSIHAISPTDVWPSGTPPIHWNGVSDAVRGRRRDHRPVLGERTERRMDALRLDRPSLRRHDAHPVYATSMGLLGLDGNDSELGRRPGRCNAADDASVASLDAVTTAHVYTSSQLRSVLHGAVATVEPSASHLLSSLQWRSTLARAAAPVQAHWQRLRSCRSTRDSWMEWVRPHRPRAAGWAARRAATAVNRAAGRAAAATGRALDRAAAAAAAGRVAVRGARTAVPNSLPAAIAPRSLRQA